MIFLKNKSFSKRQRKYGTILDNGFRETKVKETKRYGKKSAKMLKENKRKV